MAKINNRPFIIWGSGNAEREFMYANDLAKIITEIHDKNILIDEPLIVSPGPLYTIKEIVEYIVKYMKFEGEVIFDKSKPEGILKKNTENNKFKKYFSNFEFTDIEVGLQKTIDYFTIHYNNIRK